VHGSAKPGAMRMQPAGSTPGRRVQAGERSLEVAAYLARNWMFESISPSSESSTKRSAPADQRVAGVSEPGGTRGAVGDPGISDNPTGLHGPFAISVFMFRRRLHSASVCSQSCASWPRSKRHWVDFEPVSAGAACARKTATAGMSGHMVHPLQRLSFRQTWPVSRKKVTEFISSSGFTA